MLEKAQAAAGGTPLEEMKACVVSSYVPVREEKLWLIKHSEEECHCQ